MMSSIKVLIVDNDDLFWQGATEILASAQDISIVGQIDDAFEAINLIRRVHPKVVLLGLGASKNLKWLIQEMNSASPQIKIIVIHKESQEYLVLDAFRQGAVGHLPRETIHPDGIAAAIRTVNRGDVVLQPNIAGSIMDEIIRGQRCAAGDRNGRSVEQEKKVSPQKVRNGGRKHD